MIQDNESYMKTRGERKVWKSIYNKNDKMKKAGSTQVGQQLLLNEGLRILGEVKDWINNKSGKTYRSELTHYFSTDEIILQKIVESMLILAGDIESLSSVNDSEKSRHKKIRTINSRILEGISFNNAWRFIEIVVDCSRYFNIDKVLHKNKGEYKWTIRYKCSLSKVILNKLSLEAADAFYPLPMTQPPIPWSIKNITIDEIDQDTGEMRTRQEYKVVGGYTNHQYDLIRSNFTKVDYSKYSQKIIDSVNYIQSTPWVINDDILTQLKIDLKIPKKSDFIKMDYPDISGGLWDIDIDSPECDMSEKSKNKLRDDRSKIQDKLKLYNAEKSDYESAVGKYRAVKLAVDIADRYKDCDEIYFPHSYDFRGRVYPLSIGLSPQGSDEVKALISYKYGEVLTDRGIRWALAYLCSLYGDDKLDFDLRVERGQELLYTNYLEADEPYQFLAHQNALRKVLDNPGHLFVGRVHLDACNSGSQFTSAITGDVEGCKATNVIPTYDEGGSIVRKDAYILVAKRSLNLTEELIKNENDGDKLDILIFLKGLLESHGRKICKRPTMVSNYGGTSTGCADMLWNMFRELNCPKKYITKSNSILFASIIMKSIKGVLSGGKSFEEYIQKMSTLIARKHKPIHWTTSDGFFITHKKSKQIKSKKVACWLPGARRQTIIKKIEYCHKTLSAAKMRSAISPNYIHSLDAELLRSVALELKNYGIKDSDWIHDSFGCHPNNIDMLLNITKNKFIQIIKNDPLSKLHDQLSEQVSSDRESQRRLSKVNVSLFNPILDIEQCMDSHWFFS